MGGYLINFAVYVMAMVGLIFFALMIYKKCTDFGNIQLSKTNTLKIEETLHIGPKKTLYIVRAGNERFLIAGDIDKTSLISKLENKTPTNNQNVNDIYTNDNKTELPNITKTQISETKKKMEMKSSIEDLPLIVDFQKKEKQSGKILHNMLEKMNK